uniref:K Homology domain-containing protein n=1 Tax=Parascaris univalens TaxID=6257 RepID=A0A915C1H6_PARUN
MDIPSLQNYNLFGQPLLKIMADVETYRMYEDQKTRKKPFFMSRSDRDSLTNPEELSTMERMMEYLANLVKEKRRLGPFIHLFTNIGHLADKEISRVRTMLFRCNFAIEKIDLPEPEGEVVIAQEKVYIPCKEHPEYNFIGRILGPRGMTAKQLERETGCKIMVRGRGSMRDHRKEEENRGKPKWEHLDEDLHVLIQSEDTPNRVYLKLKSGVEQINKLLVPCRESVDDLKRSQLLELAIINGTYRSTKQPLPNPQLIAPVALVSPIRQPTTAMPTQPVFVSPADSPVTPGSSTGSAPAVNNFVQSPNIDYNMLMNQLSFETALASFSIGGENQSHTSIFPSAASLINTASLPDPLQSCLIDPSVITPPTSIGSDRH